MNWKKLISYKHHHLPPLHHYQIGIIFLFVFGFFLFFPFYILVEEYRLDPYLWQWIFFFPWMGFYIFYSLKLRSQIPSDEERNPLKRPIGHWVLLGISIVIMQFQPNDLNKYMALDWAFVIFSLFLADSYWDFKKIKLKK